MDLQLRGKRALVTGSTAGIGLAAAAGLYREGASVVVNGRTKERVEEAVRKIRGYGGDGQVSGIAADLSKRCRSECVAYFLKQLGSVVVRAGHRLSFEDGHAGDWSEWPEEITVREMPRPKVPVVEGMNPAGHQSSFF